MPRKPKTFKTYRDAKTGRFIKKEKARRMNPSKVIRESIPKPGYGDTGRSKSKKRK